MRQKRQYNINIIQQKYYTVETKRRFITQVVINDGKSGGKLYWRPQ